MKKMSVLLVLPALLFSACGNNGTVSSNGVTVISGTVVEDNTPQGTLNLVTKARTGGAETVTGTVGTNNLTVNPNKATAQVSTTSGRLPTNNWLFSSSYSGLSVPHARKFFK